MWYISFSSLQIVILQHRHTDTNSLVVSITITIAHRDLYKTPKLIQLQRTTHPASSLLQMWMRSQIIWLNGNQCAITFGSNLAHNIVYLTNVNPRKLLDLSHIYSSFDFATMQNTLQTTLQCLSNHSKHPSNQYIKKHG